MYCFQSQKKFQIFFWNVFFQSPLVCIRETLKKYEKKLTESRDMLAHTFSELQCNSNGNFFSFLKYVEFQPIGIYRVSENVCSELRLSQIFLGPQGSANTNSQFFKKQVKKFFLILSGSRSNKFWDHLICMDEILLLEVKTYN